MKLTPGVNFINIKRTNVVSVAFFLHTYTYIRRKKLLKWRSYEIFARIMLMKLTASCFTFVRKKNWRRTCCCHWLVTCHWRVCRCCPWACCCRSRSGSDVWCTARPPRVTGGNDNCKPEANKRHWLLINNVLH